MGGRFEEETVEAALRGFASGLLEGLLGGVVCPHEEGSPLARVWETGYAAGLTAGRGSPPLAAAARSWEVARGAA